VITVLDDFGRYNGTTNALLAACYPEGAPMLTAARFKGAIAELEEGDLLRFYRVDGREYVYSPTWMKYQRRRASESKFPQPTENKGRGHLTADDRESRTSAAVIEDVVVVEDVKLPCRAQRDVAAVFSFWQWWMERPRAKLTPDRRQKINTRLREGYGFDTIARACIGLSKSPFHRGGNDNGKVYDDITLICRNGSKLEGFADLASEQDAREEIDNWRREAGQDVAVPPSGKA
jgi:hypothetical protein